MIFDDQTEPQIVPKVLLQVSVREINNILVSDTNYGGIIEESDEENNIIISNSTLRTFLPPKLKECQHNTRSYVVVNVAFFLKLYINHCYPGVIDISKTER